MTRLAPPGAPRLCQLCRRPLPPGETARYCDAPPCQVRAGQERAADIARAVAAKEARHAALSDARAAPLLEAAARRACPEAPERVARVRVPHMGDALVAPDPDERAAIVARIERIVAEAFDPEPADPEPMRVWETDGAPDPGGRAAVEAEAPPALAAGCIACQGRCCRSGRGGLAFLTVRTIAAYRAHRPEADEATVRADYLAHLPDRHVLRSCQFHTDRGCALPREMRSDLCNGFLCPAMRALARTLSETGAERSAAVALSEDHTDHPEPGAPFGKVATGGPEGVSIHRDLRLGPLPGQDR